MAIPDNLRTPSARSTVPSNARPAGSAPLGVDGRELPAELLPGGAPAPAAETIRILPSRTRRWHEASVTDNGGGFESHHRQDVLKPRSAGYTECRQRANQTGRLARRAYQSPPVPSTPGWNVPAPTAGTSRAAKLARYAPASKPSLRFSSIASSRAGHALTVGLNDRFRVDRTRMRGSPRLYTGPLPAERGPRQGPRGSFLHTDPRSSARPHGVAWHAGNTLDLPNI